MWKCTYWTGSNWTTEDDEAEVGYGTNNFAFYGNASSTYEKMHKADYRTFPFPDKTMAFFDCDIYGIWPYKYELDPPFIEQHFRPRHLGFGNCLFLDGHIESLSLDDMLNMDPTIGFAK